MSAFNPFKRARRAARIKANKRIIRQARERAQLRNKVLSTPVPPPEPEAQAEPVAESAQHVYGDCWCGGLHEDPEWVTKIYTSTVPELRGLAKGARLTGYSKMKRQELIDALSEHYESKASR